MTELQNLTAKLEALAAERAKIHETMAPLHERLIALSGEMDPIRERRDTLRVEAMGDQADWKSLIRDLGGNGQGSQTLLRYFARELDRQFDMYHSGYWSDTGETNVKVKVNYGDAENARKNIAGVKFFTPLMTPHEDEEAEEENAPKWVWFGVFESSLSSGGIYRLDVLPDLSGSRLSLIRHSRTSVLHKFRTVEEAIALIGDKHSYGGKNDCARRGEYEE